MRSSGPLRDVERPDQTPGGVGEDGASQTGVAVGGKRFDGELDVADAAQTEVLHGQLAVVDPAELPDAGVGGEQVLVVCDELGQVGGAGLFFAFDDEFDRAGELADLIEQGIDRKQAGDELSFIVADAAPVELAVADFRLEGRAVPEFERLGRLDIVMVVDEQSLGAAAFALAENDRGAAGFHDLDGKTTFFKHLGDKSGTFTDAPVLGTDARLGDQAAELLEAFFEVIFEIEVELLDFCHGMLLGRKGSSPDFIA